MRGGRGEHAFNPITHEKKGHPTVVSQKQPCCGGLYGSGGLYSRNSYSTSHRERALGASRALAEERAAPASMVHVRFPNLGEACTAFYNEPGPKVTIGVVSVTELRAPAGIGPDVKTRPRRGTLHIEFERRNTPRTCLPGLLFDWDENMARDCNLFQPLDINFVQDSKGLFAEVECTMVLVSPSNLLGGRRNLATLAFRDGALCTLIMPDGEQQHRAAKVVASPSTKVVTTKVAAEKTARKPVEVRPPGGGAAATDC